MKITSNLKIMNTAYAPFRPNKNTPVAENHSLSATNPSGDLLKAYYMPAFGSVSISDKKGVPLNSGFYRDYGTLLYAKKYLEENFGQGCDIVVGACSTGEDLISMYSMLDNRDKYKFIGVDLSKQAIEIAKSNNFGISSYCQDYFLLEESANKNWLYLQKCFNDVMQPNEKTQYVLNLSPENGTTEVTDAYFKVKPEHFKNMEFVNADMTKLQLDEPAGAIFFRQGIYQVTNNKLLGKVFQRKFKPDNSNKREKIEKLVDNIHKNLQKGGILVLGDMPAEHFYVADKNLKPEEKVMIDDVPEFDNAIDYYMANPEVEIYRQSPLYEALFKDDRFDVLFDTEGHILEKSFFAPTVWVKIK